MKEKRRNMWQFPWGYRESIAVVIAIMVIGWMLQVTAGPFDIQMLQFPVNAICGGLLAAVIFMATWKRNNPFCRWLSGVPLAVTLIGVFVALGIIMGLTPQISLEAASQEGIPSALGFDRMTSSWAFVLVYLMILLSLGMLIARRGIPFRIRDYAFYLNHMGLWIVLFTAGFGTADTKRYVLHVREGETEWRVYNSRNEILDLPVAITLNDFDMEEYPPKLAIIERESGEALPIGAPEYFQIDEKIREGKIDRWEIRLDEYLHDAVRNSDSTYREAHMPGATPAARISIRDRSTGRLEHGWVCAGNIAQLYMVLNLDERYAVVMTQPEPKRFMSDIDVYTEDGGHAHTLLEVNKPLKIGHWMLYQYDYDKEAGRMSTYSSIEMVYDPWLIPVYIGLWMLMAGSLCMLWSGRGRKEVRDDLE